MAVVDSGRRTSSGKVIWKAAPSKPAGGVSSGGGSRSVLLLLVKIQVLILMFIMVQKILVRLINLFRLLLNRQSRNRN